MREEKLNAPTIFARADLVNMHGMNSHHGAVGFID
jgi:hypothetical protein